MKRITVDCNFNWLGPSKPALSHAEAARWNLHPGERLTAMQDDDEWLGVVVFDPSLPDQYQWYVDLELSLG